jgi:ectoine hydroxylase-related dioxygenase (phytanoyl-CoA dioxygenase family)
MASLTQDQIRDFRENGFLMVENAVDAPQLQRLRQDFDAWVEESRRHDRAYGETIDHRPRFDLEPGHTAARPTLRRVNAPIEVSAAYHEAMADSRMTDCVAALIGPDVKLHHTKINSKQPGSKTAVDWHQDFPFTPHSNDDLVTALLFVDDVTETNGPLAVMPGSHKGPIHSLWHGGIFTGAVAADIAADCEARAIHCTGKAGSVCLMHSRLLHGSTANRSDAARTLFISVYSAEDAVPLSRNPVPTTEEGLIVRGRATGRIRSVPFEIERPQYPTTASFFDQQAAGRGGRSSTM